MTSGGITHLSLNLGSDVGANDALIGIRVVPVRRDGDKVIIKTLNYGETDTGESVIRLPDEQLLFPPGNMRITIQDIDKENDPYPDGYADISNTIWTWLRIGPTPDPVLFRLLLAAARRLDTGHELCVHALDGLGIPLDEPFIKARARLYKALGYAELMCIALHRAIRMLKVIELKFSVATVIPETANSMFSALKDIRDALEHMEERAFEIVNARREVHPDALTIFDQGEFYPSGILSYASHSLDMQTEVVPVLISCRQFILSVAVEHAGKAKTNSTPILFF